MDRDQVFDERLKRVEEILDQQRSGKPRRRDELIAQYGPSPKPQRSAIMICATLGILGIHRMYLGKIRAGIVQMSLTIGGGMLFVASWNPDVPHWTTPEIVGVTIIVSNLVWTLVDLVAIASGRFRDAGGRFIITE